jgi:hypothetical protein
MTKNKQMTFSLEKDQNMTLRASVVVPRKTDAENDCTLH